MKRIFKAVCVALSCVLCLCFVGGCSNELWTTKKKIEATPSDIVEALENAGFENVRYDNDKIYIGDTGIYIDNDTADHLSPSSDYSKPYDHIFIGGYSDLEDIVPVLDVIIPLLDDSFDNYGAKVVSELKYDEYFTYNDLCFSIDDTLVKNENYMNDLDDHNEYIHKYSVSIYLDK